MIILNNLKKLKIKPSLIFSSTKQIEKDYLTEIWTIFYIKENL